MARIPSKVPLSAIALANGIATATYQVAPGQMFEVELVTATSLNLDVKVIYANTLTIDSTKGDVRDTVTSDSKYTLQGGEQLSVQWSGATPGQQLAATITGWLTY